MNLEGRTESRQPAEPPDGSRCEGFLVTRNTVAIGGPNEATLFEMVTHIIYQYPLYTHMRNGLGRIRFCP